MKRLWHTGKDIVMKKEYIVCGSRLPGPCEKAPFMKRVMLSDKFRKIIGGSSNGEEERTEQKERSSSQP